VSDPVENNFPRCRLGPLDRVLLRVSVQEHVQFRHFGNPTPIDFAVKLDRELHSHRLPSPMRSGGRPSGGAPVVVDQIQTSWAFRVANLPTVMNGRGFQDRWSGGCTRHDAPRGRVPARRLHPRRQASLPNSTSSGTTRCGAPIRPCPGTVRPRASRDETTSLSVPFDCHGEFVSARALRQARRPV